MAGDMFRDVVRPSVKLGSRAWYSVPLSIVAHACVAAIVIVVPLMATDVLPRPTSIRATFVDSPPPPPPPPVAPAPASSNTPVSANPKVAPTEPPNEISKEPAAPPVPGIGPGLEGGLPTGLVSGTELTVVPHPPSPPPPSPTRPVPVGGNIAVPKKIKDVRPVYPTIAQANRVSGTVIIQATIGADGRVQNAVVIKSIPLLDQAALEAVRQWQFTPTRLNGIPIPVIMTVTITFNLN